MGIYRSDGRDGYLVACNTKNTEDDPWIHPFDDHWSDDKKGENI